ncbi:MAG: response regulator, partial [Lachnospiraceae bacterium]|nr:response regulator [Lachnospiraceae bacterium]
MREKKIKLSQTIYVIIIVMLVGIVALNIVLMYNITLDQTEEIGRMRIQNIAAGFEESLARAESTFDRVSSDFEELLLEGTTEEEIRLFLSEQRSMEYELSDGRCLNVFCAVDGVVMISDMDTPEDYVLQERSWYRALMTKKKGEVYISPAYDDAFTDNMCFTMARMLDDGSSVIGIDYSVSEIQSYVAQMSSDGYGDAMIIDENETIVGYTNPNMIGKNLSTELPQYRDAFLQASAADADNFVLHNGIGTQSYTIFCSRTENGWYMMCSVSNWELYRKSYLHFLRNSLISVLFIIAITVLYFMGQKSRRNDGNHEIQIPKRKIELTEKEQRRYQIGITMILSVTAIIVIIYTVNTTINANISNMEEELREYSDKVGEWVLEQKSILDMLDSVIDADPELLNNYDETMKYLEDIAKYFPDMGIVYIANPDFAHGHSIVANNGWTPAEDYIVEERPWYIGAMTSREFNISEPFFDVRTGEYCITFSKVIESDIGEFYGVLGINFYMNTLRDILDESHGESGYAFLVKENGTMIGHINPEYRVEYVQSHDISANVHDLPYDKLYSQSGLVTIKDYDGKYKVCLTMDEEVSGDRIIMVRDWWEIYGGAIQYTILFIVLLGGCILVVNRVISNMIHWQRNANEELKKAAESAIQGEQAKSRFLSNMSHEIRTPINAILGMNEMILREYKDPQLLTYSGNIRNSGKMLLTLVNDILDMTKIESGKMELIPTEYKTADLLLNLWNVIYLRAKDKNLTLSFTLDETIPGTLYGDDVRIKQIVTNLLTNAVKYTHKGGVKLHAAYEMQGEDMITLIISVNDTGIGIREEDMGKLFENFQRLDENKNRNIEGTGLGMSITMMLLKMMDGDIDVESVYQEGSTFTVRIPQKVIDNEPAGDFESIRNRHPLTDAKHYGSFEAPEANILVVDDNPLNLVVFTSFLKVTKMSIVTAESGKKCLELVKDRPFHIIFMDHMMPEMDGVETFHEIQKLKGSPNEKTPVIALTANAVAGAKEYFLEEGFTDFLSKPLDSGKLEQMIVTYLPEELIHEKEDEVGENIAEESGNESGAGTESGGIDYSRYQEYGIDIEDGIAKMAGNWKLYLDMIEMFIDRKWRQDQLKQFLTEQNAEDYRILVHALKGDAKMLGIARLGDLAYEHEKQSDAGNLAYVE